ncbi:MAG: hypothetical protein AAB551_04890 [Patescibacteria group bacterium]
MDASKFLQGRDPEIPSEDGDRYIKLHAKILSAMDAMAFGFSISQEGKISKPTNGITFNGEEAEIGENIATLLNEKRASTNKKAEETKKQEGVIDAMNSLGAVIVTYDSSKKIPEIFLSPGSAELEEGTRGHWTPGNGECLGIIGIDLNPEKRRSGISSTTSLIHEMHHHLRALSNLATATDKKMSTDPKDTSGTYVQERYLDELHSSFLQRKPEWFTAGARLYAGEKVGKHEELVGTNPEDIKAVKNLICYLQGIHYADQIYNKMKNASGSLQKELSENAEAQKFLTEFPDVFIKCGALIGASKSVKQAERLLEEEWKMLLKNTFFEKNIKRSIEEVEPTAPVGTMGVSGTGEKLSTFLFKTFLQ